jgi:putative transposase
MYLVAIMDWATRPVLSWRSSNAMDPGFCVEALEEALAKRGSPEIFNSDQGSQFTRDDFIRALNAAGVRISMDGKRRWMDNVFIERLWRSLKYECVYLRDLGSGIHAQQEIGTWISYYDEERPNSALVDDKTPMEMYSQRTAA